MEGEKRLYEMGYLLKGDINEEEALEKSELFRKAVENEEGLIVRENKPKKQNLGYPIKGQIAAYSGSLSFIFHPEKIPALKKELEKSDYLLRLLLSQLKYESETLKQPVKRKIIRRTTRPVSPGLGLSGPASVKESQKTEEARGKPLQVEEIDKKLEEILGG